MSKDFEQAYKELAESGIPDLWDRIEAGLESRPTPEENALAKQKKGKLWSFHKPYSGIAAAVICAAVIIPAAVVVFGIGSGRLMRMGRSRPADITEGIDTAAAPQNGAMEYAAEDECEESAEEWSDDVAEETSDSVAEESTAAAGGMDAGGTQEAMKEAETEDALEMAASGAAEISDAEAALDMAEASEDVVTAEAEETDSLRGTLKEESQKKQTEAKSESAPEEARTESDSLSSGEFARGTVFEHVVIKVTEIQNDFQRVDGSTPGTRYRVTIQKDASGRLAEGEELFIDIPAQSSTALFQDGMFEVDLVYTGDGVFGLEEYHQQIME